MSGLAETEAPDTHRAGDTLPAGRLIGKFELRDAVHVGADSIVYRAWDRDLGMAVAVMEHCPARLVRRLPEGDLSVASPAQQADYTGSLEAFVRSSRALAHCDHPSLVRVLQLQFAHGTAYRVMPWIDGEPLSELRRRMPKPPDEAALRALLDPLLGALEALHATGIAHGGVEPANILMPRDGRPVLLSPHAPSIGGSGAAPQPWVDLRGVANVVRFMIDGAPASGERRVVDPAAAVIESLSFHDRRVGYGHDFLRAIDAAASPQGSQQLGSVAALRAQLREAHGLVVRRAPILEAPPPPPPPPAPITAPPAPRMAPVAADVIEIDAAPEYLRRPRTTAPDHPGRSVGAVVVLVAAAAAGIWWGLQEGSPTAVTRPTEAQAPPPMPAPAPVVIAPAPTPEATVGPAAVDTPASAAAAVPVPGAGVAAGTAVPPEAVRAPPPATPSQATPAKPPAAASTSPKPVRRTAPAVAAPQSPRQVCGARTEFSLYWCMKQQCERAAWQRHPQCVRFRITDRVD